MEEFETFDENLELNLELVFTKNPYLTIVIGDFNLKLHNSIHTIRPQLAGLNVRS